MTLKTNIFVFLFLTSLKLNAFFYPSDYVESRKHFRELSLVLKQKKADLQIFSIPIENKAKMDLTIDALYVPAPKDSDHLVIVTSGIHGIEGYAGAAVQFALLDQMIENSEKLSTSFLLVHAINPYGYAMNLRVDEDNVDLNRNISATAKLFERYSEDYENFEDFLNPKTPLNANLFHDLKLFAASLLKLYKFGRKAIAQIAVGGQYQNPQGIYFGGKKRQQNAIEVEKLFQSIGQKHSKIFHIDLHTGYGERGRLHFFSSREIIEQPGVKNLFEGYSIDLGQDKDFYQATGSFDQLGLQVFQNKTLVIPMTFEFGTLNSQTTLGGFLSLKNMIYENQGRHSGYITPWSEEKIKTDFLEMFNPSTPEWREGVVVGGSTKALKLIERFSRL